MADEKMLSEVHDVSATLRVVKWSRTKAIELQRRGTMGRIVLSEHDQKLITEFFIPRRGDPVDEFLKRWRDKFEGKYLIAHYKMIDDILDDYRLHADTGTKLSEEVSDPHETEILPGPYRINPDDGNAYRLESDAVDPSDDVWITDIFGSHHARVPNSEWLTWKEVEEG